MRYGAAVLAAVALTACSSGDDDAPARDAGLPAIAVEVGTGRLAFEAIAPTDTLELVEGPQNAGRYGGFHIWTSVKLVGIHEDDVDELRVTTRTSTGGLQAEFIRAASGVPFEDCGEGRCVAGFAPRLMDCCAVSGRGVRLGVEITTKDGRTAEDEKAATAGICSAC